MIDGNPMPVTAGGEKKIGKISPKVEPGAVKSSSFFERG